MPLSEQDRVEIFYGFWVVLSELHDLNRRLDKLERENAMDAAQIQEKLAEQQALIEADTNAVTASSALLDQLSQLIRDNIGDAAALEAIAASIDSNNTVLTTNNATLSDAVARNTPAEPATP